MTLTANVELRETIVYALQQVGKPVSTDDVAELVGMGVGYRVYQHLRILEQRGKVRRTTRPFAQPTRWRAVV